MELDGSLRPVVGIPVSDGLAEVVLVRVELACPGDPSIHGLLSVHDSIQRVRLLPVVLDGVACAGGSGEGSPGYQVPGRVRPARVHHDARRAPVVVHHRPAVPGGPVRGLAKGVRHCAADAFSCLRGLALSLDNCLRFAMPAAPSSRLLAECVWG